MTRPDMPVRTGLTLFLGFALAAWFLASASLYLTHQISLLGHVALSSPALYFLCICVHDGVHGVLARPRQLNQVAANLMTVVLGMPFPLLQDAHLRHHRRVGHPDDPEHAVYSAELWQLPIRLVVVPWLYLRGITRLSAPLALLTVAQIALSTGALLWFGLPLLKAWVVPVAAAVVWFGFTTVYVPHSRHKERLMPWMQFHTGHHDDHHFDVRYPWPQYAQIRAWRFRHGLEQPTSEREGRFVQALAREVL